jgi:hypothetical protein
VHELLDGGHEIVPVNWRQGHVVLGLVVGHRLVGVEKKPTKKKNKKLRTLFNAKYKEISQVRRNGIELA